MVPGYRQPECLRARAILSGEVWYKARGQLLQSVRTGEPALDHLKGMTGFEWYAANPASGALFNETLASSTGALAKGVASIYDFSECRRIIDMGGGTVPSWLKS
jgi:hypothetical protein